MGNELIELSLNALAHAGEHHRDQAMQRQLAAAAKGAGVVPMKGKIAKRAGLQVLGKRGEQGPQAGG